MLTNSICDVTVVEDRFCQRFAKSLS